MKRVGNIYDKIISLENLQLADDRARKGKRHTVGVRLHDKKSEQNLLSLHESLKNGTFQTSEYDTMIITKPKERLIYRLPYFPDRIVHHAIMNVLEPVFVSVFTADTYSCIKGRGVHHCANNVKKALRTNPSGTQYCLKIDIKKFYPSIDHEILKDLLSRKIKDQRVLSLLSDIIDSAPGVPIGNYLSQYFANFYLAYFDHYVKENLRVKHYFRYADDMVFLAKTKQELHKTLAALRHYLATNLNLSIKENYQVFPVESRGLDFVGYRFYHTHTLLRKSIKQSLARAFKRNSSRETKASYLGWALHCDTRNLLKTLAI